MPRIYLDHAATTPMLPEARGGDGGGVRALGQSVLAPCRGTRCAGRAGRSARGVVADALGWRHDVIFTSGASEAIAIVLRCGRVLADALIGATEHDAVSAPMPDATVIAVDDRGSVDPDALSALCRAGRALVAIQQANNETGVTPADRRRLAPAIRAAGSLLAGRLRAERRQDRRCPMPISSPSRRTSSAARRGSARCWCAIWRRWSRPAGRSGAIAGERRICRARRLCRCAGDAEGRGSPMARLARAARRRE